MLEEELQALTGATKDAKDKLTEQRNRMKEKLSGDWELIKVCPDSGAFKFVGPKEMAKHIPIQETDASKAGVKYKAANGGLIRNLGEKKISGVDCNGNPVKSTWQIADITKPLAGIREMVKVGNRVTFDQENGKCTSKIYNKNTGVEIPINDVGNEYQFDMWVPVNRTGNANKSEKEVLKNMIGSLEKKMRETKQEIERLKGSDSDSPPEMIDPSEDDGPAGAGSGAGAGCDDVCECCIPELSQSTFQRLVKEL